MEKWFQNYKPTYSHGTWGSKGVAILISKMLDFEIIKTTIDKDGRYLIMDIKVDNKEWTTVK